jgi:hypothetical protein
MEGEERPISLALEEALGPNGPGDSRRPQKPHPPLTSTPHIALS